MFPKRFDLQILQYNVWIVMFGLQRIYLVDLRLFTTVVGMFLYSYWHLW